MVTRAASVIDGSTASAQEAGRGPNPTAALHDLRVCPIPVAAAKTMIERHHYLHSLAGGTRLTFGIFVGGSLLGALTFGVGSFNAASLVDGATSDDVLTLSRLWLSDDLPRNSESRVIGVVLRELRRHTSVRFLLSYADPAQGHLGVVYQATGWLYTGLSEPMPLFDLGDGIARHSRSVSHAYGSHSIGHFRRHGVTVKLIPQAGKHRYVFFIDPSWRSRLRVPVLPYPGNKKEKEHECH